MGKPRSPLSRFLEFTIIVACFLGLVTRIVLIVQGNQFKGQTLWDWLQLLIIPVVLALGGYLFTYTTGRTEREIASDRQCEEALQAYIDKISELLLEKQLRQSAPEDEVRKIARVRTLTVLPRLDNKRQKSVLQFLHESGLIDNINPVVDMKGADLKNADLKYFHLTGANLVEADLSEATLYGAHLDRTNLSEAGLITTVALRWRDAALKPVWEQSWLEGSARRGVGLKRGSHVFQASNRQMHGLAQPIGIVLPIDASIGHPTGAAFGA
ncbi:MAG: pentapeptide repeat-containing protein [Ktedonobacteraceae bacterium]